MQLGTVDGSNYYTCKLEVCDTDTTANYVQVGNTVTFAATAGSTQIGFTSEQINDLVSGADYFRITVTKVGTTATGVSVSAFLSKDLTMTIVYNKKGEEFKVPHKIDVKDWLNNGYSLEKTETKKTLVEQYNEDKNIVDTLKEKELKSLCKSLDIVNLQI